MPVPLTGHPAGREVALDLLEDDGVAAVGAVGVGDGEPVRYPAAVRSDLQVVGHPRCWSGVGV